MEVPARVMELCLESFTLLHAMADTGNPNSASDAGVGALCARTGVEGAWLNVKINASGVEDKAFVEKLLARGQTVVDQARSAAAGVLALVEERIAGH